MECSCNVGHRESLPNCCRNEEIQPRGTWDQRNTLDTSWTTTTNFRTASVILRNAPHTQGVALMLSKQAQNALIGWASHGPRIIKASFKTKKEGITMNII
ncbi:unnamed protein product, partial [Schistosoma curassoni]|uniref:Laminin N-terminal domain-containing protein n=1 Tax=Schistosoma curassoni TaxID=6186 RepID=A0A183KEF1_9TREM